MPKYLPPHKKPTKSLIDFTIRKYLDKGIGLYRAELLAANELGISKRTVNAGIYNQYPFDFDLRGYKVDPAWLEGVSELYGHMRELKEKARYITQIVNSMEKNEMPIDPEIVALLRKLTKQLYKVAKGSIPKSVCPDCVELAHGECTRCGGYGWLTK